MTNERVARALIAPALALVAASVITAPAIACQHPWVSRIVEIDTRTGPVYGRLTNLQRQPSFLAAREIVLTFDDGPQPATTLAILDTLDRFCAKATFFPVGSRAMAHPRTLRDVIRRGHTVGGHTWSHPFNLTKLSRDAAADEIEKGFAAVAIAAGSDIAPFFRFPGLNHDKRLEDYLQTRGIATLSVDIVSNDSYAKSADDLVSLTLKRVEAQNGGILLFHDIKRVTAAALPRILMRLKADGYRLVHLVAREALTPLGTYDKEFTARLETHAPDADGRPLGLVGSFAPATPSAAASTPVRAAAGSALPVTRLQPTSSAPAR